MTTLPAHVTVTTETTTKWRCRSCGSRLILGEYLTQPGRAEQTLQAWLDRHRHDPTKEPPS